MARRRSKILIVDGDREASLTLHRVLYQENTHYDILLASSAEIARDIMRDITIDLMVTDIDLPSTYGVDLVCWAAIEFPETLYVIKTSNDVQELQEQISGLGCLRLLRKPCDPHEILKIAHETLDSTHRLSGCFSALSAADLIQMLCLTNRSTTLRITSHGVAGSVLIRDGELIHASFGLMVGQVALCEILAAQDGIFRTAPLPAEIEPTIHVNWQHALMDAVRTLDERANAPLRQTGSFPAIRIDDSVFGKLSHTNEPSHSPPHSDGNHKRNNHPPNQRKTPRVASSLVDKGFAALRAGNVEEARQCWLAAKQLDPDNRSLDLNLKKLDTRSPR
jgi:DNA-binding response OmpR family regulator